MSALFQARWFRAFIAAAVAVSLVASAAIAVERGSTMRQSGRAEPAAVTPVKLGVYFDGVFAGWVKAVGGCVTYATTVTGLAHPPNKSLAGTKLEPCVIRHSTLEAPFENWLVAQLGTGTIVHDIGVVATDGSNNILAAVKIHNAVLTRFATPALDKSSTSAVFLTSTISGQTIRPVALNTFPKPVNGPIAKSLNAGLFSFTLNATLDGGVTKVAPVVVSRTFNGSTPPGDWNASDFTANTTYAGGTDYATWYANTVLATPQVTSERSVKIKLLSQSNAVLFEVDLSRVGIVKEDAGMTTTREWTMYFEALAAQF